MPRKGWKSITVKESLYKKVEEEAEKEGKSVTEKVSEILLKEVESLEQETENR